MLAYKKAKVRGHVRFNLSFECDGDLSRLDGGRSFGRLAVEKYTQKRQKNNQRSVRGSMGSSPGGSTEDWFTASMNSRAVRASKGEDENSFRLMWVSAWTVVLSRWRKAGWLCHCAEAIR